MGSRQSTTAQILRYVKAEWEVLTQENQTLIVRNKVNDREAQVITIMHDPRRSLQKELDIYNYRYRQDNALVSVYAVDSLRLENQPTLCGNFSTLTVVVQLVRLRLSDLRAVNLLLGLYILSESLRGFHDLYGKVGKLVVTDKMIVFNSDGRVKVWLHQNLAQNHPDDQKPALQITSTDTYISAIQRQQAQMIQNVVELINAKVQGGFSAQLLQIIKQQTSFSKAYYQLQKFCQNYNLSLPDRLDLNFYSSVKQRRDSTLVMHQIQQLGSQNNNQMKKINQYTNVKESQLISVNRVNQYGSPIKEDPYNSIILDWYSASPKINKATYPPIIFTYVTRDS